MSSVDEELKEMFDAYSLGILKKIRHLYIPHLTSYIISSISVAVAMGVKIVIMAELLGANNGMGAKIANARAMLETTEVMAYVLLSITLIMLFEHLIIEPLKIALMPWRR
jgi:abcb protein